MGSCERGAGLEQRRHLARRVGRDVRWGDKRCTGGGAGQASPERGRGQVVSTAHPGQDNTSPTEAGRADEVLSRPSCAGPYGDVRWWRPRVHRHYIGLGLVNPLEWAGGHGWRSLVHALPLVTLRPTASFLVPPSASRSAALGEPGVLFEWGVGRTRLGGGTGRRKREAGGQPHALPDREHATLRGDRVNGIDTGRPGRDLGQAGLHPLEHRQVLWNRQLVFQGQPLATARVVQDPTPKMQLEAWTHARPCRRGGQISRQTSRLETLPFGRRAATGRRG